MPQGVTISTYRLAWMQPDYNTIRLEPLFHFKSVLNLTGAPSTDGDWPLPGLVVMVATTDPNKLRLQAQRRQGLMLLASAALGFFIIKVRNFTGERTVRDCLRSHPPEDRRTSSSQLNNLLLRRRGLPPVC